MLANTVVDRETVLAVFDEYDTVCEKLAALTFAAMTLPELLELQSRREIHARRAPAVDHRLLAEAQTRTTAREIGAKNWAEVLAIRLRISRTDATRRIADAALLGPRTATTGEPLPPVLPATAAAQATGQINTGHVAVITTFFDTCPVPLDAPTHAQIDDDLAAIACGNSPEILKRCTQRITFLLHQDGPEPPESVQERRRGIQISPQGLDGLSKMHGYLDAETAATFAAILAKLGAPGMCNRADDTPCVDGTPSTQAIATDTRSTAQRTHDAFLAMGRALLASGTLGQHNGLPVSVVICTTVGELESLSGVATTSSGTRLSIPQVIAMAAHARHYLAVFANHKEIPLYLGRSKRIASPGQRLVLHARDRGCTKPGCANPPDRCQGHHGQRDYAQGGRTDITDLALACPADNRLVNKHGWTTHIRTDGRVEWIPPLLLDTGQDRLNHYWHPEDLSHPNKEADNADGAETRGHQVDRDRRHQPIDDP
ncbi:HNH endonuclease signature motif containing protein [Mycobacterium sp. 155]|uniref:HNH endonuclease signature motif containing protein n=1 Tax=Mycobacterium sp. 155 TaxID=1157943 RepID=UPI000381E7F7|nr:HNH endonuclease signature motif containing protein [Mycobacterium sp. 155]